MHIPFTDLDCIDVTLRMGDETLWDPCATEPRSFSAVEPGQPLTGVFRTPEQASLWDSLTKTFKIVELLFFNSFFGVAFVKHTEFDYLVPCLMPEPFAALDWQRDPNDEDSRSPLFRASATCGMVTLSFSTNYRGPYREGEPLQPFAYQGGAFW